MARLHSYDAFVLRAVDIGEADRFCILFTREAGRKAVRARGVRKPKSRIGGTLLPFSHVRVEVSHSEHSAVVTSAQRVGDADPPTEYGPFSRLQQGTELLLRLTEDDHPLPEVYDLLLAFFRASLLDECEPVLPFTLSLLSLLGLLPAGEEDRRFARLSVESKKYVLACSRSHDLDILCSHPEHPSEVQQFIDDVLHDTLPHRLKVPDILRQSGMDMSGGY